MYSSLYILRELRKGMIIFLLSNTGGTGNEYRENLGVKEKGSFSYNTSYV